MIGYGIGGGPYGGPEGVGGGPVGGGLVPGGGLGISRSAIVLSSLVAFGTTLPHADCVLSVVARLPATVGERVIAGGAGSVVRVPRQGGEPR